MMSPAIPSQLAQLWLALGRPTRAPVPSASALRTVLSTFARVLGRLFPEGSFVAAYPRLSAICVWRPHTLPHPDLTSHLT